MFKWLKYLVLLPQLLGLVRGVLQLVREAEDFVAGGQRGAEKRQLVLSLLDTAMVLGARLGVKELEGLDRARILEAAGALVDTIVGVLNTTGIFQHAPRSP